MDLKVLMEPVVALATALVGLISAIIAYRKGKKKAKKY